MHEHVSKRKLCSAQLVSMDAPMDQGLLISMSSESFGDSSSLLYVVTLSALLIKKNLTRLAPTFGLLQ